MKDFKVRCVRAKATDFTEGKIYHIKNSILISDIGIPIPKQFDNVDDINSFLFSKFELVPEIEQFTKADLKTGMRVETREGDIYIVFLGTQDGDLIQGKYWNWLESYNNDLTVKHDSRLDIVNVYSKCFNNSLTDASRLGDLLWHRPEPKHYTKSEAIARLSEIDGQPVEIGE